MSYYASQTYYSYYSQLGAMYEKELALNRHEVMWLNKFMPPVHAFMQVPAAREATVRLFVAVLNQLDERARAAGSTLLRQVKELEVATEDYDYVYVRSTYQHIDRNQAGRKVGAAVFLTILQHCENAVRERFGFKTFEAGVYFSAPNDPNQEFDRYFGNALPSLITPLAQALPAPDLALEQALNLADPKRWQLRFEELRRHLPAAPARFAEEVHALGQQNEHNPHVVSLYQQGAWQLGAAGQPAALGLYLHYLYHGRQHRYPFKPKPLLKRMQKLLFPRPEHLARFQALSAELLNARDQRAALAAALAALPTLYHPERRKIELSPAAVQAARQQHAGTVELLNEYLEEPEATPTAPAPPRPAPRR